MGLISSKYRDLNSRTEMNELSFQELHLLLGPHYLLLSTVGPGVQSGS